jgi:hypothetical protein
MKSRQKKSDGGKVEETVKTTIRVPRQLMERIDALIEKEEIQLSKNVWLLQAIKEKLDRGEQK